MTNHTVTIAAELENGVKLVGQCEISHPVRPPQDFSITLDEEPHDHAVDDPEGSSSKPRNVLFEASGKDHYEALSAKITRMYYHLS